MSYDQSTQDDRPDLAAVPHRHRCLTAPGILGVEPGQSSPRQVGIRTCPANTAPGGLVAVDQDELAAQLRGIFDDVRPDFVVTRDAGDATATTPRTATPRSQPFAPPPTDRQHLCRACSARR